MFDHATARPTRRIDSSRFATTGISIAAHILIVAAVAIPALFATNALPAPPTVMAFVVDAVPAPPPPPPTRKIEPTARENSRRTPPKRIDRQAAAPVASVPAPIEAPTGISTDFSDPSLPALDTAAAEARRRRAPLHLLHLVDVGVYAVAGAAEMGSLEQQRAD